MKTSLFIYTAIAFGAAVCAAIPAFAAPGCNNRRSYVSSAGADANSCSSPTTACVTIGGAVASTVTGGEVTVLDANTANSGDLGPIAISQSITIDGGDSGVIIGYAGGAQDAIVVNAPADAQIILRNITLNGLSRVVGFNKGINGVNFVSGGLLQLENAKIQNFTNNGVNFTPNSAAKLVIINSVFSNNDQYGIFAAPTAGGKADVALEHGVASGNWAGARINGASKATIRDSVFVNNTRGVMTSATVDFTRSSASANTTAGLSTTNGAAKITMAESRIFGNGTGLDHPTGQILSFGNNEINGNTTDGAPTGTVGLQ